MELCFDNILSKIEVKHGRGTHDTAAKGKFSHAVEILSSDHSSDDSLPPSIKPTKKMVGKQNSPKIQKSTSRGLSTGIALRAHRHLPRAHI